MSRRDQLPKTPQELEQFLGVPPQRTVTQADVARLTRKRLGPSWGRERRPRRTP